MKKTFLFATALLLAGIASAQVNTVVVNTNGDVKIRQAQNFEVNPTQSRPNTASGFEVVDSVLYLNGVNDFNVTVQELNYLTINSRGDVETEGTINGKNLSVNFNSSGDTKLDLNYDNVYVMMTGSGDLVLKGHCDKLDIDNYGTGDLDVKNMEASTQSGTLRGSRNNPDMKSLAELMAELGANMAALSDSVDWDQFERDMERWGESMEEWGRHMEEWGEQVERRMGKYDSSKGDSQKPHYGPKPDNKPENPQPKQEPKKRSLLFDPHWNGVDAGLNLLFGPGSSANFEGEYAFLELKPLKSWNFNFNIADVGIAFSRSHVAGLYTGIGLGWNNYSLNHPVRLVKGDQHIEGEWVDETVEGRVKKSKLGVLYVQAPLMIEVRPTRGFFIAAGVTGGLRIDTWSKIKFIDKHKEKVHSDYYVNPLKLDATLRAGGNDMGFYASFNLLPLFDKVGPDAHTFNVGFSLLF